MPLNLYEYKLILESMLLDKGYVFDLRTNIDKKSVEDTYRDYALGRRAATAMCDTELARSSFNALTATDLTSLIDISGVGNKNHSITILKRFLLRAEGVRTKDGRRPTLRDIDLLFNDLNKWLVRVYSVDSVKSVMASNGKVKFCLLREFCSISGFNNYGYVQQYPHIVDVLHNDYISYCRINASLMIDTDNKLGHEGENYVALVGTLVSGMMFFIRKWVMTSLPDLVTKMTNRGSGEESFDVLDVQGYQELQGQDINLGMILREIASVNDCLMRNKTTHMPCYSIITWFQTIYTGPATLTLTLMLQKFLEDKFSNIEKYEGYYSDYTEEDMLDMAVFNMSKDTCWRAGDKVTSRGNVVFLASFATTRVTPYFWKKFSEVLLPAVHYVYKNRDTINLTNLYEESSVINAVEKGNMVYTPGTMHNETYDRILYGIQKRYGTQYLPTNIAVHAMAMLLYGVNTVKDLVGYLESEGLSIMDLPIEQEMYPTTLDNISNIDSLLYVRGVRNWSLNGKYESIDTSWHTPIMLVRDEDLESVLQTPVFEDRITDDELPNGSLIDVFDTSNDSIMQVDEEKSAKIVKHQRALIRQTSNQPIYPANTDGREQYLVEHNIKSLKLTVLGVAKDQNVMRAVMKARILVSFFFSGYIKDLKPISIPGEDILRRRINELQEKVYELSQNGQTSRKVVSMLQDSRKQYVDMLSSKCKPVLKTLSELNMFSQKSLLCKNVEGEDIEFLIQQVVSKVFNCEDAYYIVGMLMYLHNTTGVSVFANTELHKIMGDSKIKDYQSNMFGVELALSALIPILQVNEWLFFKSHEIAYDSMNIVKVLNNIIESIQKLQVSIVELGRSCLNSTDGCLIIGGENVIDSRSEIIYNFKARKLDSIQAKYIKVGNAKSKYYPIKPDVLGASVNAGISKLPQSEWQQIYVPRDDELIVDGKRWVLPSKWTVCSAELFDQNMRCQYRVLNYGLIAHTIGRNSIGSEDSLTGNNNQNMKKTHVFINGANDDDGLLSLSYPTANCADKERVVCDLTRIVRSGLVLSLPILIRNLLGMKLMLNKDVVDKLDTFQYLVCALDIISICMQRVLNLISPYNKFLDTIQDYNIILELKHLGRINHDQYRKNQIAIASYSDTIQMILIHSKADILSVKDFIFQMQKVKLYLSEHKADEAYQILKTIGVTYQLPLDGDYIYHYIVYPLVVCYTEMVFSKSVVRNIENILSTIGKMECVLNGLFKLRTISLTQVKLNMRKFERCKRTLIGYTSTKEYMMDAISCDRRGGVLTKLKERYRIDRETGVLYNSEISQYFLACANDPSSTNVATYNVLVHSDGMVLVYNEVADTFYRSKLECSSDTLIQALLRGL